MRKFSPIFLYTEVGDGAPGGVLERLDMLDEDQENAFYFEGAITAAGQGVGWVYATVAGKRTYTTNTELPRPKFEKEFHRFLCATRKPSAIVLDAADYGWPIVQSFLGSRWPRNLSRTPIPFGVGAMSDQAIGNFWKDGRNVSSHFLNRSLPLARAWRIASAEGWRPPRVAFSRS